MTPEEKNILIHKKLGWSQDGCDASSWKRVKGGKPEETIGVPDYVTEKKALLCATLELFGNGIAYDWIIHIAEIVFGVEVHSHEYFATVIIRGIGDEKITSLKQASQEENLEALIRCLTQPRRGITNDT